MSAIEFYFDPVSPYAWLASTQLDRITAETGCTVTACPILFAGLLKAHGHKGPAEIPAKRDYIFKDVMRRAHAYGLSLEGPPAHPFNPLKPLRAAIAIDSNEQRLSFSKHIMELAWANGLDINADNVLSMALEKAGADVPAVLQAADSDEIKNRLVTATHQAVEAGLFGVPSFRIDNQLFWGDDRIQPLLDHIAGHRIDEQKLAAILSRGASSVRKTQ